MSKSGKWSCVQQSDSLQMANCPMQMENEFHWEHDNNPAAWRSKDHYEWTGKGFIEQDKLESFYRQATDIAVDADTDTVDEFYVGKEIVFGAVIESKSSGFGGWSIVVRTVIRWEENMLERERRIRVIHHRPNICTNEKPSDIARWEQEHGLFKRSNRSIRQSRNNVRRRTLHKNRNLGSLTG